MPQKHFWISTLWYFFLFVQVYMRMRWLAAEQIIMDTKMMCIYFSIIHWQPCISWIMKDFVKLSELFLIYTFDKVIYHWYTTVDKVTKTDILRYDEKPRYHRYFYTWSTHFINWCGYFSVWLIIFKYGINIYLNFFLILYILAFIFYNF